MDSEIVAIYVVCDDILHVLGVEDDPQTVMSTAEIVAFSIVAAKLFGGNHRRACWACLQLGYFPKILSPSRLNRRLHKIPWGVWMALFQYLALVFKKQNKTLEYAVDSCPIPCCKKTRINRRKFLIGEEYIDYAPSEKRFFCGVKVHMVVTGKGEPVELALHQPASYSDLAVLRNLELDLPENSVL